jgi:hypothetical protein
MWKIMVQPNIFWVRNSSLHRKTSVKTDGWVCVVPTHNYAGSKQTSFRIRIMEIYVLLDKAKHNTRHLILAAVMWLRSWCGNSRHIWHISTNVEVIDKLLHSPRYQIWRESVQCKPLWYMLTDGQTDMIKAIDFFAVCTHVPKDAAHKKSYGSWIHVIWLHLFSKLQSLSGP